MYMCTVHVEASLRVLCKTEILNFAVALYRLSKQRLAGSEIHRKSENPFSQRFLSTKLRESKWILINISVYHIKLYGKNPLIFAKFHWENPNGFLHLVTNF